MDSSGDSLNSSGAGSLGPSPHSSLDGSLPLKSLYQPNLDKAQTIRPETGKYKGYTLRAYEPEQSW